MNENLKIANYQPYLKLKKNYSEPILFSTCLFESIHTFSILLFQFKWRIYEQIACHDVMLSTNIVCNTENDLRKDYNIKIL